MNVKVLSWIMIVLILAVIAIALFVPKHIDPSTGNLKLGKSDSDQV